MVDKNLKDKFSELHPTRDLDMGIKNMKEVDIQHILTFFVAEVEALDARVRVLEKNDIIK